jgi:hypothetical protein
MRARDREGILAAKILMVLSASIVFTLGVDAPRLYVLGANAHAPRPRAANQHEPDCTRHYERNNNVAVLGGLQCQPQHGTYFVRLGFRFSRTGSWPTPLSITVPARCRVGNAWWSCCALQGLFFSVPLVGISISLACYVASIALSRALITCAPDVNSDDAHADDF